MQVFVRGVFWAGDVPFLFLPSGAHPFSHCGDTGGPGVFVTTPWKREAIGMKVVVVEKRKGVVALLLRRLYGIKKLPET